MASHSSSGTRSKHVEIHKIVILGDGGVGKSALTMQFVCNEFLDYHDPTIEDAYQQQARIDGKAAQLDILDTAGQPEFTVMRDQYMRTGEGFIICYSVIDRRSFEEAIAYRELITRVRHLEDIPMVLVGNKCDLENLRKVGFEEGNALASQWDCPFLETSAAVRTNVEETFSELVREIRNKEKELNKLDSDNGKQNSANGLRGFFRHFFQKKNKT